MTLILKTEGLNKTYRLGGIVNAKQIQALNDVNITVESDKPVVIAIVGESGSGKTTLAKTLLRLETPTSGRAIVYDRSSPGRALSPTRKTFWGWCSRSSRIPLRRSVAIGRSMSTSRRRRGVWPAWMGSRPRTRWLRR